MNVTIQNSILLSIVQTLCLLVTFYFSLPTVRPSDAGTRARQDDPFRTTLAAVAAVFAVPVVLLATGARTALGGAGDSIGPYLLSITPVAVVLVIGQSSLTQDDSLLDPASPAYSLILARRGETAAEIRAEFDHLATGPRWFEVLVRSLAIAAVAASYVTAMIPLALIGDARNAVFPVLELLVLPGLIREARRDDPTDSDHVSLGELTDIDSTVYEQLSMATRGMRSATSVAGARTTTCNERARCSRSTDVGA